MSCAKLVLLLCLWSCQRDSPEPLTVEAIEALPDRVERLRALERVVYSGAWDLERLDSNCAALQDPELAQACRRYLGRPHLFRGDALERGVGPSTGARPAGPPLCEQAPSLVECAAEQAWTESGPGCASLGQPLAQAECWFVLSDRLRALAPDRGREALDACLAAGVLKGPCLHHHAEYLGGRCAPLGPDGVAGWTALAEQARTLEEAVAHWDPFERQQLTDVVWAGAMRCAFQRPQAFDPGLVALLPAGAAPHLRAALAWHVVGSQREGEAALGAWELALADALATGATAVAEAGAVDLPAGSGAAWSHDAAAWSLARERSGGELCGSAMRYFAMGKRLVSDDPTSDGVIVLLEAAARLHHSAQQAMDEARLHPDVSVRCTAGALSQWMARSASSDAGIP